MKKRFKVVTLGCRTNQYESQAYADQLRAVGFEEAKEGEVAELCIVNTCTVTESADASSRHQIRHLAKEHLGAKLIVTGCLAERNPEEIQGIAGVTTIVSNKNKETLLPDLFPELEFPEFSITQFAAHTRAFVKIQDGCNSFCTYCIIPYVRGRSRSRRAEDIVKEIRALVANGYKEVVLTGINIGDFDGAPVDNDAPMRLHTLVRLVDQIEGLERIRISSIDPDEVDDDLIDAIVSGKKTCHSLHLVLQSGSNSVLKRMNRKYTKQIFMETVERLRLACPDFTFTTDVIVGFPGETEADFQDTLEIMQQVQFAKVHMFPYSERKRTRAALFPNKVPQDSIKQRKALVLEYAERCAFKLRERYVGRTALVLVEDVSTSHPHFMTAHTGNFLPVLLPVKNAEPNTLIEVKLLSNTPDGLIAEVV